MIFLVFFVQIILLDLDLVIGFREKFEMFVFFLLNLDGVDYGNWRYNVNGKDLNRDWQVFSQLEIKVVKDWLINVENIVKGG